MGRGLSELQRWILVRARANHERAGRVLPRRALCFPGLRGRDEAIALWARCVGLGLEPAHIECKLYGGDRLVVLLTDDLEAIARVKERLEGAGLSPTIGFEDGIRTPAGVQTGADITLREVLTYFYRLQPEGTWFNRKATPQVTPASAAINKAFLRLAQRELVTRARAGVNLTRPGYELAASLTAVNRDDVRVNSR